MLIPIVLIAAVSANGPKNPRSKKQLRSQKMTKNFDNKLQKIREN